MPRFRRWTRNHKRMLRIGLPIMALGVFLVTEPPAQADTVSATVSVTVSPAAAVTTSVQTVVVVPTVSQFITQNLTSNVGFGSVAPVAAAPETTAATATGSTPAATAETAAEAAAQLPGSSNLACAARLSAPACFGVSGAPNQAFSISLPSSVAYTSGGSVITLTNIGHNGGQTPTVGDNGAGQFAIGANVSSGSGEYAGCTGNQVAACVGEPFLPVIVAYN